MMGNQTVLQARTEVCEHILWAEKYKLCEIYKRMCDVYREALLIKHVYKWFAIMKRQSTEWKHTDLAIKKKS